MSAKIPKQFQQQCEELHKRHIAAWKESGLTKAKYCFEKGLSLSVFSEWCVLYDKTENEPPPAFIPIAVKNKKPIKKLPTSLQIEFSNGVKVHLSQINDIKACLTLLRGL